MRQDIHPPDSQAPPLRVVISGGGTGGHIMPGLAIARALRDRHGAEVRFVGTARGLETRLVPEAGFPLQLIRVGQLKSVSLFTRARTVGDLPRGVSACTRFLREFRPHVVIGVGGYASGPAMLAALLLRVPTLAFEPNAAPGLANRLVGRFVLAAAVNFPETASRFRNSYVTGIPVRPEFFAIGPRPPASAQRLLVMGGSQGARALNQVLPQIASELLTAMPSLEILHQTGERHAASTIEAYERAGVPRSRVQIEAFLPNAAAAIASADLLLCRSGASTVAEICAAGRPAIYVPFPHAADDHQRKNADAMSALGAARALPQFAMTPQRLLGDLKMLLSNPVLLQHMAAAAKRAARPQALEHITTLALALARRQPLKRSGGQEDDLS